MISEVFLTCALATTPGLSFTKGYTDGDVRGHNALTSSADFLSYINQRNHGKVLLVGGDPRLIAEFMQHGLKRTFGVLTDFHPKINRRQAIADPEAMPFLGASMIAVFWMVPGNDAMTYKALKDAIALIVPNGYFIYENKKFTDWKHLLNNWGWHKLPFMFGPYVLWQKPETIEGLAYRASKAITPRAVKTVSHYVMHSA